jgi:hypothetical protein
MQNKTDREILLSLIGSLTLCDHMGDVADDVDFALKAIGVPFEWEDLSELGTKLGRMGVRTLYGSSLEEDDSDDE